LIINSKNQPLLITLGGCLEGKPRPNQIGKLVGYNKQIRNKWKTVYYFLYKILKFSNQFFFLSSKWVYFLYSPKYYDSIKKSTLDCSRWLAWRKKYAKPDRQI